MGGRGSPGRVGGQFRPEGWHEVVGRVWDRGGGSSLSLFGAFPDAEVRL